MPAKLASLGVLNFSSFDGVGLKLPARLSSLGVLRCPNFKIENVQGLDELVHLEIRGLNFFDFSSLRELKKLKRLQVTDCKNLTGKVPSCVEVLKVFYCDDFSLVSLSENDNLRLFEHSEKRKEPFAVRERTRLKKLKARGCKVSTSVFQARKN